VNAALARLIAAQMCLHACMAGMRMAAPLLALRQGYSEAAVGVLLALFALMQVFLALPAGRFADLHGLRRPTLWAVAVAIVGTAAAVLWPVFGVLCLAALCTGGASGAASIALQRHVGRAAVGATQLKQVFSWLSIGPALSNFLGPFSAGLLIDFAAAPAGNFAGDYTGFRVAFFMLALLPVLTWWFTRGVVELPPVVQPSSPPGASPGLVGNALGLLRERAMRRLLVVNWLLSACWDVHTFLVPVLGHERGLSASVIGSLLGAFAMAAVAVRLLLPLVASRVREWAVIAIAMVITAVLLAIYPLLHAPLAMGACSVLLGLALGSVQPMVMSTLHQTTPQHLHGQALGLRLMTINASSVLMPLLFGMAGAAVGLTVVFWATAAAVGGGARLAVGLRHKNGSDHAC
jgi:predicted MFS family arabinose efflux permease